MEYKKKKNGVDNSPLNRAINIGIILGIMLIFSCLLLTNSVLEEGAAQIGMTSTTVYMTRRALATAIEQTRVVSTPAIGPYNVPYDLMETSIFINNQQSATQTEIAKYQPIIMTRTARP